MADVDTSGLSTSSLRMRKCTTHTQTHDKVATGYNTIGVTRQNKIHIIYNANIMTTHGLIAIP